MGFDLKNRFLVILALLITGAVLASAVTQYFGTEPPLNHHVTTGKVGTNPDGTVWIAEFIKDRVVFNYTLPASSVHSKYLYYAAVSIVAVPEYSQEFRLVRTEEGEYAVYVPERDATVLVSNLRTYMMQYEDTVLLEAYSLFSKSIDDVSVLSKVHEKDFAINGVVTLIHKDMTTSISGYILTVGNNYYLVMMDLKMYNVKEIRSIEFEYK
ncbi:hypothetical protein E2P71_00970 [Candidatus Bathyarchaeota archaeon]|nr:hypothetical protein E2P71_00970 [Candidatus Bathyarchaeota archaeon]